MNLNELTSSPAWGKADVLANLMMQWADAYYNHGNSPVEDPIYDAAKKRLEILDPYHPYLAEVGAPVNDSAWNKLQHKHPVGSLDKVKSEDEFQRWISFLDKLDT